MVEFDVGGVAGVPVAGFDDIGVEGALGEEVGVGNVVGGFLEDLNKPVPDELAFLLRIIDACEITEERFRGINNTEVDVEVVVEGVLDEVAFFFAEEPVVDKHAGELVADGFVEECGDDGGVDSAGEATDDAFVADGFFDLAGRFVGEVSHLPEPGAFADFIEEVAEEVRAMEGVGHFGVELDADEGVVGVDRTDGGAWAGFGRGDGFKVGIAQVRDLVAVGHPDLCGFGDGSEDAPLVGMDVEHRASELGVVGFGDACAEEFAAQLHAIADAQDGDAQFEDFGVHRGRAVIGDRRWPAGEDNAFGIHGGELISGDGGGDEDGVDACIADTAADELGGLGAEIEDGDGFVVDVATGHDADSEYGSDNGRFGLCGELGDSLGTHSIMVGHGTGGEDGPNRESGSCGPVGHSIVAC